MKLPTLVVLFCLPCLQTAPAVTVTVDATRPLEPVNRGLFSLHGYMQLRETRSPRALRTFHTLNPRGTDTRIETMINLMEPENDNDDPAVTDPARMHFDKMLRFISDTDAFMEEVAGLGMTPVILLDYCVPWLSRTGQNNGPPKSVDEWAEFAAAAVGYLNSRRPASDPIRFVEVWNEPNLPDFFSGTKEDYFALFNAVADRLHREFPGIGVGGPALTPTPEFKPDEWFADFIRQCGPRADFLTHHSYGHPVEKIIGDIRKWVGEFRKLPGKENGRILITESDHWLDGRSETDGKLKYVLDRQFALLGVAELCRSFHNFSLLEDGFVNRYRFGLIGADGSVIYSTYWPYWLFRYYGGRRLECTGQAGTPIQTAASIDQTPGGRIIHVALYNPTDGEQPTGLGLKLPPSEGRGWVVITGAVGPKQRGIRGAVRLPPVAAGVSPAEATRGNDMSLTSTLAPAEATCVTIFEDTGKSLQQSAPTPLEEPWLELQIPEPRTEPGQTVRCTVLLLNTTPEPIRGRVALDGLPTGWTCKPRDWSTPAEGIPFGKEQRVEFEVNAAVPIDGAYAAVFGRLERTGRGLAVESIPVRIYVDRPVEAIVIPPVVRRFEQDVSQSLVRLINRSARPAEGTLSFNLPGGVRGADETTRFWLAPGAMVMEELAMTGPLSAGTHRAIGRLRVGPAGYEIPIPIEVAPGIRIYSVPVPLDMHYNADSFSWESKPGDFTDHSHAFPAEYAPPEGRLFDAAVEFAFPSTANGARNAVHTAGQAVAVDFNEAVGLAVLAYAVNGDKDTKLTLVEADGKRTEVPLRISNWCTPPVFGEAITLSAPYRYDGLGRAVPPPYVYRQTIMFGRVVNLKEIVLPRQPDLLVFAVTVIPDDPNR